MAPGCRRTCPTRCSRRPGSWPDGPDQRQRQPAAMVLLRTEAEKARLLPMLDRSNRDKSRLAPVVAILAHDVEFWRRLDRLHPHVGRGGLVP